MANSLKSRLRTQRLRSLQFAVSVARNQKLNRLARYAANLILLVGLLLTAWGLFGTTDRFASDLSALTRFAGGGEAVVSSATGTFQSLVLEMLGLKEPEELVDTSGEPNQPPPEFISARQTLSVLETAVARIAQGTGTPQPPVPQAGVADEESGLGFVPFRVEPEELKQHAPALPVTGGSSPPDQTVELGWPTPTPEPTPEATPLPPGPPTRIVIPRIGLDAPVELTYMQTIYVGDRLFQQWGAPAYFAGGWQEGSALLGQPGNTVINGHHNIYGMVFGRLVELQQYDEIYMYSGETEYRYLVSQVMTLEEKVVSLEQRQDNARWILPSDDERLTLVTCWPPSSNTYRLIVVAVPAR